MKNSILPVNIQLFAEGDQNTNDKNTDDKSGDPPPAAATKTFTQEDVNSITARESKTAVEKLLKEAGIAPEGDYKASMQAFKKWQDDQKTELEKKDGALTTLQAEKEAAETKASTLERQIAVMSNGIPAEKANVYIKLAEAYVDDKTDFKAAIALALKDFPLSAKGVPGSGGNPPAGNKDGKKPLPTGTVVI